MVRHMLSVLMDGIKDAGMFMDYAEEAEDQAEMSWFKNHAKEKIDGVARDYDYICRHIGLVDRANEGDEIADALVAHLKYQMMEMSKRYNAI